MTDRHKYCNQVCMSVVHGTDVRREGLCESDCIINIEMLTAREQLLDQ